MTDTLRILGLDLSLTATGIALTDGSTLTLKTRDKDGDKRLVHIEDAITEIAALGADLAVIEDLPRHAMSAGITGMVHGAVRTKLLRAGIPYALVVPATLKAYATGSGSADKAAMALAAYKRVGREFPNDNECDAWWLRLSGLDWLGQPETEMPRAQRARLSKAKWPLPPSGLAVAA